MLLHIARDWYFYPGREPTLVDHGQQIPRRDQAGAAAEPVRGIPAVSHSAVRFLHVDARWPTCCWRETMCVRLAASSLARQVPSG